MHRTNALLLFIFCLFSFCCGAVAEPDVRIGVLAKRGSTQTISQWGTTADYLTAEIPGRRFVIVPLDFDEIGGVVASDGVDFVLANPAIYVEMETLYRAGRIATMRNRNEGGGYTRFGGVIFTRADRQDIQRLVDIQGKRFAAVQDNSLGGYLMAWREMEAAGISPRSDTALDFAGTHDAVVFGVLSGKYDAGTVRTDTLERMAAEGKIAPAKFKVLNPQQHEGFGYLSSTRLYPEWPIARLRHTPEALSHAVATALLRMPQDSDAAKAASIVGWTVPRNYQPVHELLRALHVGPYEGLGKTRLEDFLRQYWHWLLSALLGLLSLSAAMVYVARLNRRLRRAEGALIDSRDHLAEKVRERTAALEESHRRLERISRDWNDAFDAISDPIFIHDGDMRLVQANPAYCERAGHSLEEMVGRPYYDFFPKSDGPMPACRMFPESLQNDGDEVRLDNGEVFVSRSYGIKRADNTVRNAIHILKDVTAIRRTESRRRTLSRALEQAGEGILILDREREVLYCNPGLNKLLACSGGDGVCRLGRDGIERLVTTPFIPPLVDLFAEAERHHTASAEVELVAGGELKPAYMTVGSIRDEGGALDGYVLTMFDLSEIRSAQDALTYRIGFESVIAEIASSLINVEIGGTDEAITEALHRLGQFAETDRAYLFEYDRDSDTISNTHGWCASPNASQIDRLQSLSFTKLPWMREKLLAGEVVRLPDVASLPEEAAAEREEFLREDILSLLNVPLSYGGVFFGFIGFDNIKQHHGWAEEDARLLRTAGEIIINSLVRVRSMHRLQRSEASLAEAQQIAHVGNWDWNIVTGELRWSDEIYRIFGLQPQQFTATYDAFLERIHPDDRDAVIAKVNKALTRETVYRFDHRIIRPDGSERVVLEIGEVSFDTQGQPLRMNGTVQDVTEMRRAENEMRRLNRALRTLGLCNTTLVHAQQEQALLEDICHILIEHGNYLFAWVGYAERDEPKTIRPVAYAGSEDGYLDTLSITWADDASGQNPAGNAIRNEQVFIARDITHDVVGNGGWRETAMERGYVSVIALPLISQGEIFGAIIIDSNEADAFDQAEQALLQELAGDLAFGIRTLRARSEQQRAEAALKETEARYEELYEGAPNAYLSVSADDNRLLQFNQALCDILGYERETLKAMTVPMLYADTPDGLPKAKKMFAGLKHGRGARDVELQMRHRDGRLVWVSVSIEPVLDEAGSVVESRSSIIDISARKHAEAERRRFAEQLQRSLFQTIRAIALTIEKRDPYTAGHQERVAELAVMLGRIMGLDEPRLEGLRLGAMIHDIGKISVPSEILNRPGKLEPALFNIIKMHPVVGYDIISGIEFPWPLAKMVLQHHERYDGGGYPNGLKGEEILLEARILAVADVVEAMASHRPYRPALGVESAIDEIEQGKGSRYDPEVVAHCLKLFREGSLPWPEAGLH